MEESKNRKFKILSIDGGGLRGLIPLQVIKQIEEITGEPIHKSFDLIAGTSTGGLLACALTLQDYNSVEVDTRKYTLEEIEAIYKTKGSKIFPKHNIIVNGINGISKWFRPQFKIKNLISVLNEYFDDNRITSCLRPIFITSYNIHRTKPLCTKSAEVFFTRD